MATTRFNANDMRHQVGSPRPKGRGELIFYISTITRHSIPDYQRPDYVFDLEHKDTLCRNVVIYGHCRYEDQGCAFNHDQNKSNSSQTDL